MKTKITLQPKKIPYYLLLTFLTSGAGLILGFLSFSGLYVLFPILPLAFAAFGLSVAYEGEIYLQNIKGSLKKLFKYHYVENHLAKTYLLQHFPDDLESSPPFFKDYSAQLRLLEAFLHKPLDEESAARKAAIEKTLKDMEKWFALQLFDTDTTPENKQSEYSKQLRTWLTEHDQKQWQDTCKQRKQTFWLLRIFSGFAGAFMTLGTTYLIVEAFSVIPFFMAIPFAVWPLMITPMALIAGTAYGLLTFNAATDFVNNNTVHFWYNKLRKDWQKGFTLSNLVISSAAVFLVAITSALTICTAGTWWTVANNAKPLFGWMKNMPRFIMGVINPIITGLSALCFNFQNTAESLEMVDQALKAKQGLFAQAWGDLQKAFASAWRTENWLQLINPFRILLKLTILPLRVLFFIGHLLSIGVTADRMPGLSEITAALIAIISEGFEDAHYFVGHGHGSCSNEPAEAHAHSHGHSHSHGHDHHQEHSLKSLLTERLSTAHSHNHDLDIPTILIRTIFIPVYFLAAAWDYLSSTDQTLDFQQAWNKQRGLEKGQKVHLCSKAATPSGEWQKEQTIALIDKYQRKHLASVSTGRGLAEEKIQALNLLKEEVRKSQSPLADTLRAASQNPVFNQHRWFKQTDNTATQDFVENLPIRVTARAT